MQYNDAGDGEPLGGGGSANQYIAYVDGPGGSNAISHAPAAAGSSIVTSDSYGGFTSGVWYQIGIVRDGTTVTFYKNGVQLGATKTLATNTSMSMRYFGKESTAGTPYFFQGVLDDVRVYNKALSAAEVLALYNMGK